MPEVLSSAAERTVRPPLAADIIIANAPDPVFVCDLEGKILEANDAVSRLLGLRRDEVLEQSRILERRSCTLPAHRRTCSSAACWWSVRSALWSAWMPPR